MRFAAIFALLALVPALALASPTGYAVADFQGFADSFNGAAIQFPAVGALLGSERINVDVTLSDGTVKSMNLVTEKGQMKNIGEGKAEDPTMTISTTQAELEKIAAADNPGAAAISAINNGGIKLESTTFWGKIKLFFAKLGLGIAQAFGMLPR